MRIGFFTDSYYPYTSGVVRSIETFVKELRKLGHDVFIFAPNYPNCQREEGIFRFASIPSPTNQNFTLAIPFSPQLGSTVRRLGLEIIHVHSPFLLGSLGARCARRFDLPLVATYHTLYDRYVHYVPIAQHVSRWFIHRLNQEFYSRCDLVVTPTKVIEEMLLQNGVTSSIEVIPTGIDLAEICSSDPDWIQGKHGVSSEERVLLYVGRLGREKNVDFLLRTFARVCKKLPETRLVLVGSGPQANDYKEMAQNLGIDHRTVFTGNLGRQEVVNCYARAQLFVFASLTETQGLVLAERLAAGLPAVAIKAWGTTEMVNDGTDGYLVEQDEDEFYQRVLLLMEDQALHERMRSAAHEKARELSSERSAVRLAEAYERIIRRKPGHHLSA